MTEHDPIKVGYDLTMWERFHTRLPIYVRLEKNLHWQICGSSGSGKSYLLLMLLRNIITEYGVGVKLWLLDFKASPDFDFMENYCRYYAGDSCAGGLEDFYNEYLQVKNGKIRDGKIRLMLFDEWAGFIVYETQKDKKRAERFKGYILEVLLLGRSMLCGIWVIMQRNDAKYIEGRDQFFVTIALGKMSREMKLMVMQGDELEQREVYACGEGIIRMDAIGTRYLKVPGLRDIDQVRHQIMGCLARTSAAGGGGGGVSGRGHPPL